MNEVVLAYTQALARVNDRHMQAETSRQWDWDTTSTTLTGWLDGEFSDQTAIAVLNLIK